MYTPEYHRFFKRDIERDKKSGQFSAEDFTLLKEVMCKFHSKFPAVSQTCFHFSNGESGCKIVA